MSSLPPPAPPGPPAYPGPPGYQQPPPPSGWQPGSPGPVGYGRRPLRSLHAVSRWLMALLGISVAMQIINLPVLVAVRSKALQYLDDRISRDTFRETLNRQTAIGLPSSGVRVAVLVLSIIWMYRVAENHRALGRQGSTFAPGWAIGGWFTPPGFAYVVPWLMLRELWKGSDPSTPPGDPSWRRRRASPLLTVWWLAAGSAPIITIVVAIASITVGDAEDRTDRLARVARDAFGAQIVATGLSIVASAVFAKIVWDLTRRQQALTGVR